MTISYRNCSRCTGSFYTTPSQRPMAFRGEECPSCGKWHFTVDPAGYRSEEHAKAHSVIRVAIIISHPSELLKIRSALRKWSGLSETHTQSALTLSRLVKDGQLPLPEMIITQAELLNDALCEVGARMSVIADSGA